MSDVSKPSGYQRPQVDGKGGGDQQQQQKHSDEVDRHLLEGGDKIPFVDSVDNSDDDDDDDDEDRGGTSGNESDSEDDEDDVMTESQENLAMAYVNRFRMPSLAERRNQGKLTVAIEHEKNAPGVDLVEEAKDKTTELKSIQDRVVGLRRNSISLPTLTAEELNALHQARADEEETQILVI